MSTPTLGGTVPLELGAAVFAQWAVLYLHGPALGGSEDMRKHKGRQNNFNGEGLDFSGDMDSAC